MRKDAGADLEIVRDLSKNAPSELDALKKKLLEIIRPIFSEALLPTADVGSELDEMKFGVYTLAASLNNNSLIKSGWSGRAAFRAYQILLDKQVNFGSKAHISSLIGQAYDLLRSKDMPKREEIKYEDVYDNILFHARRDQNFLGLHLPRGLASYYKTSKLYPFQKVTNRLCFYLKNFNFHESYIAGFYAALSYSDNASINENLSNIVKGLRSQLSFNEYVSLKILSQIAICDSGQSIPLEKMSCSYAQPKLSNLLIAISAKLPAIEIISELRNFCASADDDVHANYEALFVVNKSFEKYYMENRLPRTQPEEKHSLKMELALIVQGLASSTNDRLRKIGDEMNSALLENRELKALLLLQKILLELTSQGSNFLNTPEVEKMFRISFDFLKEKYFDLNDGVLCLKAAPNLRPEGLTPQLQIEPITIPANAEEILALEKLLSQDTESSLLASVTIHKHGGSTSYYFPGIQTPCLEISGTILRINLNFLSKIVASELLKLVITSLKTFRVDFKANIITRSTSLASARRLHESLESLNKSNPEIWADSPLKETATALAKKTIESSQEAGSQEKEKSKLLKKSIANLEAIQAFHDKVDLTLHAKSTSPRPRRTSAHVTEDSFFQEPGTKDSSFSKGPGLEPK